MKVVIRYFFRFVRLLLAPIMLISETLTTPKPMQRSAEGQREVDAACQQLALYQFRTCPFCIKVRKHIRKLNLPIELRDAQQVQQHRDALLSGGGKIKVPCLRIASGQNENDVEWMYESDAIIDYLSKRFADISKP
ncbi:MAG: glutathione S-transferase N-terminal domain-containing protein [Gammaproteobacteria bacterium]|nr:glutathione S-transferase N-terminal domain-containing protein [Gammaproteobacteria bacterium]